MLRGYIFYQLDEDSNLSASAGGGGGGRRGAAGQEEGSRDPGAPARPQ